MANFLDLFGNLPGSLRAHKPVPLTIGVLRDAAKQTYWDRTVQWFPETLQEQVGADWEEKKIAGGSHPLYTYTGGTGRPFSLSLSLSSDRDPQFSEAGAVKDSGAAGERNPDLAVEVAWFRNLVLPTYSANSLQRVVPPPVIRLTVPNLGWGVGGDASVYCLCQSVDITYDKLWPSGSPRLVTIALAFVETVQETGKIRFIGRDVSSWKSGMKRGT
jgi:hypothetical protein